MLYCLRHSYYEAVHLATSRLDNITNMRSDSKGRFTVFLVTLTYSNVSLLSVDNAVM